jgi:hypothetical protein
MVGRSSNKVRPVFVAAGLILLASACSGSNAERRGEAGPLLAAGPSAYAYQPVTDGRALAPQLSPLAEQMRRDPNDRVVFMERMRRQILHKTRDLPQDRYAQRVRPDLRRQLVALGFDEPDADLILSDVDRAR